MQTKVDLKIKNSMIPEKKSRLSPRITQFAVDLHWLLRSEGYGASTISRMLGIFESHAQKSRSKKFDGVGVGHTFCPMQLCAFLARRESWGYSIRFAVWLGIFISLIALFISIVLYIVIYGNEVFPPKEWAFLLFCIFVVSALVILSCASFNAGRRLLLKEIALSSPDLLYDWLESLATAGITIVKEGTGQYIDTGRYGVVQEFANRFSCSMEWEALKKNAREYLVSWAVWILHLEAIDNLSQEVGESRVEFAKYHNILHRIGLAEDQFDSYYVEAASFLAGHLEAATSSSEKGLEEIKKPESRVFV